jgi:MurNAc alpha-1-phosphate uridylyltransferase
MRPLTDQTPKPLLPVHGRPLIEWHLLALARDGVREVVINTAWLEEQIVGAIGDGARFGLTIRYSREGRDHGGALETAGGIATALPLLVDSPDDVFWVVSADIHAPGFRFDERRARRFAQQDLDAHLWMVPNPPEHLAGDFGIDAAGFATDGRAPGEARWTYANLALARPFLVAGLAPGERSPLRPWFDRAIARRRITAERHEGAWVNVGTPQQWQAMQTGASQAACEPAASPLGASGPRVD